jgi:hypothetical protein
MHAEPSAHTVGAALMCCFLLLVFPFGALWGGLASYHINPLQREKAEDGMKLTPSTTWSTVFLLACYLVNLTCPSPKPDCTGLVFSLRLPFRLRWALSLSSSVFFFFFLCLFFFLFDSFFHRIRDFSRVGTCRPLLLSSSRWLHSLS